MTRYANLSTFGVILWLLAILFFVMYAFGWNISDFDQREELGLGLALFVAGALVPQP